MKKKMLLLGSLALLVLLIMGNVSVAGKKHVDVVEENVTLVKENGHLKQENGQLKHINELSNEESSTVIDSLAKTIDLKHQEIISTEQQLEQLKQAITYEKVNNITSPANTSSYQLEPTELPSTEDNN
jgi:cell division protein FtsX